MRFIGVLGLDGGGMSLNSRMTEEMSFSEAAGWYNAAVEYFEAEMTYGYSDLIQVVIGIYNAEGIDRIEVEPIDQKIITRR